MMIIIIIIIIIMIIVIIIIIIIIIVIMVIKSLNYILLYGSVSQGLGTTKFMNLIG